MQCDCKQAQNATLSEKCSRGQWPVPRLPMGSAADAVGTGSGSAGTYAARSSSPAPWGQTCVHLGMSASKAL